ncbi:MAG: hypothetical protein LUG91_09735 [Ruminococcus sp.]|nr:hypothetical protein [Ruminococcus sp.]
MELKKKKFLKSEFGQELLGTIQAWDKALERGHRCEDSTVIRDLAWCQAQWEVYQKAIKHFYGIEYHFTRTDEYYGLCTEDECDFLFKKNRELPHQKVTRRGVKVDGKWFWDDDLVLMHLGKTVNVTTNDTEVRIENLSGEVIATFDKSMGSN